MEQELRLQLLGGCSLQLDGEPVTGLLAKQEALLAYLALSRQEHARTAVAGLLWGGKSDSDALRNLRVNLAHLRPLLGNYLHIGRQTLAWNKNGRYWLDVEAFETYLQRSRLPHGRTDHALLREAVALYQGTFMAEFEVSDAAEFDDWLAVQRQRLQTQYVQAVDALIEHAIDQEQYASGIADARRLLAIEPWREETQQQLMWLLALDGQISAALAQYEQCCAILQETFAAAPTAVTEALYADIVAMRDSQQRQPTRPLPPLPDPAAPGAPFQPPSPPPYFLGREQEVDKVWQWCKNGRLRRLIISGMGGVGKTSLAHQLAATLRPEFPDGVLWANATSSDPLQIAEQWAAAYGYDFGAVASLAQRAAALRQLLADKKVLLIFDDVVEAARIRPLLPTAGASLTLITSRNAGLAHLLDAELLPLAELSASSGLALLTRLLGQERVAAEVEAATAVCHHLHNLPLALTIAGRYLALRPRRRLHDFVRRVQDQAQRLQALELDDVAVRVSFMISWQALDEVQKQLFRWLGLFNGRSFTAAACAAIAELQPYPTQDRLHALVMLSLLDEDGDSRYQQHPLLADFAREQLGDDPAAQVRLARYFRHYAEQHAADYGKLQPEWENLSASIAAAYQQRQWDDVVASSQALRQAWFARGRYAQARDALSLAVAAAKRLEDETAVLTLLLAWGTACLEQSDYAAAANHLQAVLALARELAALDVVATAQYLLARVAIDTGEFAVAEQLLAESQQLRTQLGDCKGEAELHYRRARLAYDQGRYDVARELAQRAQTFQESAGDEVGLTRTLRLLASVLVQAEPADYPQAQAFCRRALALSEQTGEQGERALCLELLAHMAVAQQALEPAESYARESLGLLQQMGDLRSVSMLHYQLGRISAERADFEGALVENTKSLQICRELDDRLGTAYVLYYGGTYLQQLDQAEAARRMWEEGVGLAKAVENQPLVARFEAYLQGA